MVPIAVEPVVIALSLGFWVVMSVAWAPFLAADSIERLFTGWPTRYLVVNYGLAISAFVLLQVVAVLVGPFLISEDNSANLMQVFQSAIAITAGLLTVAWIGLSVGLPRLDRWDPTADGYDGRAALAGGAVWYLLCSGFVYAVLTFLLFLLAFPAE